MRDAVAGGDQASEVVATSHNEITIGDVTKGPGTSLPVFIAEELRKYKLRILLRETHHLKEDCNLRFGLPRGDSPNEFGFRLAYVDTGCPAKKSGDSAKMIEMVMCDEEICASQVQAEVSDRLLHYFVAVRMSHPGIDDEIPAVI